MTLHEEIEQIAETNLALYVSVSAFSGEVIDQLAAAIRHAVGAKFRVGREPFAVRSVRASTGSGQPVKARLSVVDGEIRLNVTETLRISLEVGTFDGGMVSNVFSDLEAEFSNLSFPATTTPDQMTLQLDKG